MIARDFKKQLLEGRRRLQAEFNGNTSRLLLEHSKLVDKTLRSVWETLSPPSSICLIAVGGYGRQTLFPHSDIDLLILLNQAPDDEMRAKLEEMVSFFWDSGLEVGHSVRTLEECLIEAAKDITVQTNLIEARLIAGNDKAFADFTLRIQEKLSCPVFCNAKQLEQQQRHLRFHDTSYNLEPNIKESPGGLRDLQNILWISRACRLGSSWRELATGGIISFNEAEKIARAQRFLENLRIRLHFLSSRREDRLLFDFQSSLALSLGFSDKATRRASEQLMQRYYRTAKSVTQMNIVLLQNLREKIFPRGNRSPMVLSENFQSINDLLELREDAIFETNPSAMLEGFLLLERHPELKGMGARTLRALWRATAKIGPSFRKNEKNKAAFMQILREPKGITHTLRLMSQYGFLGKYIPAFGRIVGQMQHDLFHVYTVDEHILKVVRNLRRFLMTEHAHEYPLCSRLISEFERPELLYLAGLFHDIAKGRGGDHSALGKKDALIFCRQHSIDEEDAKLVSFLVENHLVMSSTAQKTDLSDPGVIEEFARKVGDERRLIGLYLLTVSDIRGTSPTVWNAWKEKLLEDLFRATQRFLRGDKPTPVSHIESRKNEAIRLLQLYAISREAPQDLWSRLDMIYFLQHDPNEIAWHSRLLFDKVNSPVPIVKARMSPIGEGLQVMIYAPAQKDLFAQISGFFEKIGYDIAEAKIHTTSHGFSLNSYLVLDPERKTGHYRDLISFIEHDLVDRLKNKLPLPGPLQGRLSRHLKHFPITPQVKLFPDERGIYQILTIIAGDRPGLLFRIARILTENGIEVKSAKINTLGERAEDVFLVSGSNLKDQKNIIRIEAQLLQELQT